MHADRPIGPDRMSPAQAAELIDAAFRSPQPLVFLDTVLGTFGMLGRKDDAAAVFWLAYLFEIGEVEALLRLRAAWRQGLARDPAEAAHSVAAAYG